MDIYIYIYVSFCEMHVNRKRDLEISFNILNYNIKWFI